MKKFLLLIILVIFFQPIFSQSTTVEILSAVIKDKRIENAEVVLQRNGEVSVKGFTNAEGKISINSGYADDNQTLIIIKKEGHSNLIAKCPCNNLSYALSPVMDNLNGMRVVLSWGQMPLDLDSHLVFPNNHIYFQHKEGTNANLDVDDTDSFGPETITIEQKKFGENYDYMVHDYSNLGNLNSYALSNSQAKVFVYVGESLVKTYYVPQNKIGNLWKLFRINENGEIQDINVITNTNGNENFDFLNNNEEVANAIATNVSESDIQKAKKWNKKGENEYHAKNYNQAINYYQIALNLNPLYGQAYSNLGLAYQKNGQQAEAIWANRMAINYASGSTENTVKASSYYNIARIFEENNEFQNALDYFKLAKSHKQNTIYDNAINRMKEKLR